MHILFILDYFPPYIWWIETLFNDVTDFCIKRWYIVTVITSRHDPKLFKIEKRKWITIYRIGSSRFTIIRQALRFALTHQTIIQSIDHIHTSTFTSALPARIISKIIKKPCTITVHEIYDTLRYHLKGKSAKLYIAFEHLLLRLKWDGIVTVSHYTQDMVQSIHHIPDKEILTIYNQIDTHFWNKEQRNIIYIKDSKRKYNLTNWMIWLFVGRLGNEKGLLYLIASLIEVIQIYKDFKLIIIAPKILEHYSTTIQKQIIIIQNQIKDNYLTDNIVWIDQVSSDRELRDWMSVADIGIVPSMSEWFCYTAVQMQAMWLSLIASKVWALPEVLDTGHTFVPYGKVKLLSDAIINLLDRKYEVKTSSELCHDIDYQAYCDLFERIKER